MKTEQLILDQTARVVDALRNELQQYGEILALLDQQQEAVMVRAADDVMKSVVAIHQQMVAIQSARTARASEQEVLAEAVDLEKDAAFADLLPKLPGRVGVTVEALVAENNELLAKVQRRAQQNHLLLSRSVELMQQFMNALVPANQTKTYNDGGQVAEPDKVGHRLYEAVG